MTRRISILRRLAVGLVAIAIAASFAPSALPTGTVGAVFTDGTSITDQNVTTATIEPLANGAASRSDEGVARGSWTTPELPSDRTPDYTIERTVDGATTTVAAAPVAQDGTTSFADDLTVAPIVTTAAFTKVVAGYAHSCGIAGGAVYCWGDNSRSQLGRSSASVEFNPVPAPVQGLAGSVVDLVAGQFHTCAVVASGETWCWGANDTGQLGNGTVGTASAPVRALVSGVVTAVAAGSGYTCAIVAGGAVSCWGTNYSGQLGVASNVGSVTPSPTPAPVAGLSTPATALTTGANHTCAILVDGSASCWGNNYYGQLGSAAGAGSTYGSAIPTPTPVQGLSAAVTQLVATNGNHTCAVLADSTVSCWGRNDYGQLGTPSGLGEQTPHDVPTTVVGLPSATVSLATGTSHTCAVLADTSMRCWGWNYRGQLGSARLVGELAGWPTPDRTGPAFAAGTITAGSSHTCAIGGDGAVRCWGGNRNGQMGRSVPAEVNWPWSAISMADIPAGTSCEVGWVITTADRCAPGPDITVSYRIGHSVGGWTPSAPLQLDARPVFPLGVQTSGWRWDSSSPYFDIVLSNPTDKPMNVTVTVPAQSADGTQFRFFRAAATSGWLYTDGVDHATRVIEPGQTAPLIRPFWRTGSAGGQVISYTISVDGYAPHSADRAVPPRS